MGNGVAIHGDVEHRNSGFLGSLANRLGNLVRFSVTDAHLTLTVAHDDKGRKIESTAALDHFGHAGDVNYAFVEFIALISISKIAPHLSSPSGLKLQPRLAGRFRKSLDSTMVFVSASVEHHFADARAERPLCNSLPYQPGLIHFRLPLELEPYVRIQR